MVKKENHIPQLIFFIFLFYFNNWLKQFRKNLVSLWNFIPNYVLFLFFLSLVVWIFFCYLTIKSKNYLQYYLLFIASLF